MALTNRTLILFKYFWEATDEAHPVSLADISAQLKEHGITADPRTLRSDIEQLVEFGVDIVKERRVQNLYHVATRHFEAPEVKLLIDAVQSARFITPGKSKELVKRLTTFVAPGDAALLERHLYIDSRVKAVNESVYISVDRIQTAIAERKKIAFRYFDYSPAKERVHRRDGQIYFVSPYALLWNNDTYYLVGFHEHRQQIAKFRVDRIDGLELTQRSSVKKPRGFNVTEYFSQEFSMLNGKTCRITLLCVRKPPHEQHHRPLRGGCSHADRGREPFRRGDNRQSQQQFLRLGIRLRREDEDHCAAGSGGRLSKDAGELQRTATSR